jgi:colicin import membrane protein
VAAFAVLAGGLSWYLDLLPGLPSPHRARAEAELARKQAETEAEAVRAKAKADADAKAQADVKRALEDQRAAKSRALMEAELVRARAETEEAKRRAEEARRAADTAKARPSRTAEAAPRPAPPPPKAAEPAAATVAAAPKPSSSGAQAKQYDGRWAAEFSCSAFAGRPAFTSSAQFEVANGAFNVQQGQSGQVGSFNLSGTADPRGRLQVSGDWVLSPDGKKTSKRRPPQSYKASFDGRYDAGRFEGTGQLGAQECAMKMSRAP